MVMIRNLLKRWIGQNAGHKIGKASGSTNIINSINGNFEKVYCYSLTKMEKLFHQDFDKNTFIKEFYDKTCNDKERIIIRKIKGKDFYLYTIIYEGKNIGETKNPDDVYPIIMEYEYNRDGPGFTVKGYNIEHEYDSDGNLVEELHDNNYNREVERYYLHLRNAEFFDEVEWEAELQEEIDYRFWADQKSDVP